MNYKHKGLFALIFSLLLMSACSYDEGTFTAKADDVFTLELPNYLSSSQQLAPGAPIQFRNQYRTIYVVGLYSNKGEAKDLDAYSETIIQKFKLDLKEFESELIGENTEAGLTKRNYRLSGRTTGEKIEYLLMVAEDDEYYYQVCTWTLDFRMEKYGEDLKSILSSFKKL